jgi:polar amino acid transport system substrate-binding protein
MDGTTSKEVFVFDQLFTRDPLFLALAREDADFRLLIDRTLSDAYSSEGFASLYTKWCGPFDANTRAFFEWVTLTP